MTRQQAHVGYLVPGGELKGGMTAYKKCGAFLTWTFLLDDDMIDKALDQAIAANPFPGDREIRMDLNFPSSCYTLRVYEELKQ
ncbi:MAG: hypothetical protein JNM27_15815 [Leptospirales bacterium]|nr:hypothetical protein [Leptospirales bacterium]